MVGIWCHPDAFVTWRSRPAAVGQVLTCRYRVCARTGRADVNMPGLWPSTSRSIVYNVRVIPPARLWLVVPPPTPAHFLHSHRASGGIRSQCTGLTSHCWPPWPSVQPLHDLGLLDARMSLGTATRRRRGLPGTAGPVAYTSPLTTIRHNGPSPCGSQTLQP